MTTCIASERFNFICASYTYFYLLRHFDVNAFTTFSHLLLALLAGGLIGMERTYHGHAAGFRTYALVSMASAMLMLVATAVPDWNAGGTMTDPTRVVQGLMTGIGFLGAGVIVKEGFTVRGLTTAASIWVTAAIGILVGAGFYAGAAASVVLTLSTLSVFRAVEGRLPRRRYVRFNIKFPRDKVLPEPELKALVAQQGFQVEDLSYELNGGGQTFEYLVVMWSKSALAPSLLVDVLAEVPEVLEMKMLPSRD